VRVSLDRWVDAVWYGDGAGAVAARAALAPFAAAFGVVAGARGRLYDAGLLHARALPVPAIGVGNLTVGGTGKTPVAAWLVRELAARGTHPAVLLRGVGDDEARVHALLNPDAPVVADPDRVRGAGAAVRHGADVLVLDDAFQHRRAARDADVVLVAAETFAVRARFLPAGPYRESLSALGRARVVVVTRKAAPLLDARAVASRLERLVVQGGGGVVVAHLAPDALECWGGAVPERVERLAGTRVLAVAGVGAPDAFAAQLRDAGASVSLARFPDHHAYDDADVGRIIAAARDVDRVVTTLKDAVKLGPRWPPHAAALWYVTQRVTLEAGASALVDVVDAVATAARTAAARLPHRTVSDPAARGRHA